MSPSAVPTVENIECVSNYVNANTYDARVCCIRVCVFACAHVLCNLGRAYVCLREFTFILSEYFVYLYALLCM